MKRVFIKEAERMKEVRIFNLDNNTFTFYYHSKNLGFKFGVEKSFLVEVMGYKSIKHMIKELKKRNLLGAEISYRELFDLEKIGYIKLGIERIKRAGRINTADFQDVIEKLKKYGIDPAASQKMIIESYLNSIQ